MAQQTQQKEEKKNRFQVKQQAKKRRGKEDKRNIPPSGKSQSPLVCRRPKEPGNGNE
jgi:hypothetical protein